MLKKFVCLFAKGNDKITKKNQKNLRNIKCSVLNYKVWMKDRPSKIPNN